MSGARVQRLRIRVKPSVEGHVRWGHPWIYAESIREVNREGACGETAVIYDRKDEFLAAGLYDPHSPIRVRLLVRGKPENINTAFFKRRLQEATAKRKHFAREQTAGYRIVHGENDGLPGFVIDRYADTIVVKFYTAIWFIHWDVIRPLLEELFPGMRCVIRFSRNIQLLAHEKMKWSDGQILMGKPLAGPVDFQENGIHFEADVLRGQKTGFFLDQRENRQKVRELSKGRRVLNLFSFTGGFSLYAAAGGARETTDIDISKHALDSARRNFELNSANAAVRASKNHFIKADALEWIAEDLKQSFDLVIIDPPSMAKRELEKTGAIRAYTRLARQGALRLYPGGILLAASCSAHVTEEEFFAAAREGVSSTGRAFEVIHQSAHPLDHPATYPEARYLKAIYFLLKS